MTDVDLSTADLRAVTAFAAACADTVLGVFEAERPDDDRPRVAVATAWEFAEGGERGKPLRDAAWAALKAAQAADGEPARQAARAAMAAAGAAYLHPLAKATQVKHIVGAAAHAVRAAELVADGAHLEQVIRLATPGVTDVLSRYPAAPDGGGRVGELMRVVDSALRV